MDLTTPPNHNTADQPGAMQPTSSASIADHVVIAEFLEGIGWRSHGDAQWTRLRDALPELRTMLQASATVPQVVQAPSNVAVKTATKVFQSIFFNAGLDGESAYEQMQRAMRAAIISSEYVADPIVVQAPIETVMVSRKKLDALLSYVTCPPDIYHTLVEPIYELLAAPIVATVPSEQARVLVKMHEARADFNQLIALLGFDTKRIRKQDGSVDWSLLADGIKTRDGLSAHNAEPDAYMQIGLPPMHDGERFPRIDKPASYNSDWWQFKPLYYAALISPAAEQASDVRNAALINALKELHQECGDTRGRLSGDYLSDIVMTIITSLKSAPAAKGNAQDEVES